MRIQTSRLLFTMALIVVLTTFDTGAASPLESAPLALNIKETIEQALMNHPGLKAEKEKLRIDYGRFKQAKRRFQKNPELSIDANHRQRKFSLPSGKSGVDFELRLLQEIEMSGQRKHRIEASEKYLIASKWRVRETERRLRLKVTHLFYNLLTLQEKIKIQAERLALHEDLLSTGQRRFEQEDISVLEIDTIRFDRDQVQHDLSSLETEKLIFEKALRSSLDLHEGTEVLVTGRFSRMPLQKKKRPNALRELENCALNQRPDLKVMQATLEGDLAAFQLALSKKVPNIFLGPLFKSDNEDKVIGASMTIPLPFFDRNQEEVTEARVNLDVQQITLDAKKLEIRREVGSAYRHLQLAKERFNAFGADYLDRLKERMAFPRRAYRAGEISIFEFSVAQGRLAEAQIRYFDAQLALHRASADLDAQLAYCEITAS